MSITYTKLKSGAWGARSTEEIKAGQAITVTKKSGGSKQETVEKVVWSGNGVWLVALVGSNSSKPQASSRRRRDPDAPGRNGMMPGCGACRSLGRMCKQCAFDEYDC